ncbi:MAG: TSUP family transporter, partial [Candidatus Omnitrophica bacterium]|nr:TSUP family transporter [Candidatus Omnitrophota bacterium]
MTQILYVLLGLVAGIFGGLFGIGGAIIIIPALVYLFGLTQHAAQGTTLAIMVFPVGFLAALRYYQSGNVNLSIAVFICLGFFFGGYI